MLILPAIDLLDGRPVRLTRGDFDAVTDYARDAAGTAVELERAGARWLHIVDLDAARGSGDNRALIAAIRGAVGLRLQVGGGVRTLADARRLLDMGVDRVVVGSALARDPRLPERWAAQVGDRLVAGIDRRRGRGEDPRLAGRRRRGGHRTGRMHAGTAGVRHRIHQHRARRHPGRSRPRAHRGGGRGRRAAR